MEHNGPTERYLKLTGKTQQQFEAELKKNDVAATLVFTSDLLFGQLGYVAKKVEDLETFMLMEGKKR